MVWVDYLILGTIGLSLAFGVWRGFLKEALSLAAWAIGFWVALSYWSLLARKLEPSIGAGGFAAMLAFILLFVAVLIVGAIINHYVAKGVKSGGLKAADRALGGVFGAVRGIGVVAVLLLCAGLLHADRSASWRNSRFVPYFEPVVGWLHSHLDSAPKFR